MDDNPVFQSPTAENIPPQQPMQVEPPPMEYPPPPLPGNRLGLIVKALIGLGVIGLVVFLIFKFLVPVFTPKAQEDVTLTYWGLWEQEQVMQGVIQDFQRQNPKIKVKYEKQDVKQYRDKLQTRIPGGTGPDIFRFHNSWLPMFSSMLVPLPSDVITKEEFGKIYYPVSQNDLVKNGAIYGLPTGFDTISLFVNTEILQSAGLTVPTTWDEFVKAAEGMTVADPNDSEKIKTAGAALGTYDNITHAPDIVSLFLVQNNTNMTDMSKTAQNAADALTFYTCFAKANEPKCLNTIKIWDDTLDPSQLAFAKGNVAMYFGYSWDIFAILAINHELQFEVHPVPHLPQQQGTTIASYWPEGVSVKSKHQKEALLFLKYLSQKDVQQKLYTEESKTRVFGEPYARLDLADTLKSSPLVYPFVSQGPLALSSYFASDTYDNGELNSKLNGYLGNAVRSMLGNTSAQSAVETLGKGTVQILGNYGE